ncbi:hypothetical protein QKC54_gp0338 [Megavirus baoshan]|uniref:Uncharacterized protein n=1 Tax=Megavirus baoshan TaxID=2496520 RepID=A0A3Q8U800_9VIRU|nr:hypothetical protein QKC54_gp0338 [Megavirus baoshan]AZL89484.1 hypothetical protein Mb0734 [Megavirus baoshan]
MHHNLANQNPMINSFNTYTVQNPNIIPFQNNQLINNNVHVMNNLNNFVQHHKMVQNNMSHLQQQNNIPIPKIPTNIPVLPQNNSKKKFNIIEEMLKPQKIKKDNKDVESNYKIRENMRQNILKNKFDFEMTNAPYKNIIKDKIITKNVKDVKKEDLLVHKSIKGIDDDREKFNIELNTKNQEKEQINNELEIEFNIDNYDKHKKTFEYKETFIRNLAFEQNVFDENKQDCIEFYRKQQKEAEKGKNICDEIIRNIVDEGIISKDELPTENDSQEIINSQMGTNTTNINDHKITNLDNKLSGKNLSNKLPDKSLNNKSQNNKSVNNKSVNNKLVNNKSVNNKLLNNKSLNNKSVNNKSLNH